jgi:hypothetical protein
VTLREHLKARLPNSVIQVLKALKALEGPWFGKFRGTGVVRGGTQAQIDEMNWFELQFHPQKALDLYGIHLPSLPPDEVQLGFTARSGRVNLQQAFSFYRYVHAVSRLNEVENPRILDFGGGWGRISRFFLKDTRPELIFIADCMTNAIDWLQKTNNHCRIIKNGPLPPIDGLDEPLDLIYAFSVFSHLSESCMRSWVAYFMECLRPNGVLVLTTRGHQFIEQIEQLHREKSAFHARLRELLPTPDVLRDRHLKGEFQFYPIGGAGELTSDFYGETFIPKNYFEKHYGGLLVDFTESVPDVDQSVVVLRRAR